MTRSERIRILERVRRRLSTSEGGFTLVELLIVVVISGIIASALASAFVAGAQTTTVADQRLKESKDAQLASAYFVADAANATYFSKDTRKSTLCPDASVTGGGDQNVALFEWSDTGGSKSAYYVKSGTEIQRRYCEGSTLVSKVAAVQNLGTTAPEVTCPVPDVTSACTSTPAAVQLKVTEASGYSFSLRATPRPGASTPNALRGIAAYIGGGGMTLGGSNSNLSVPKGTIQIEGGPDTCNGSPGPNPGGGFYSSNPSTANQNCGAKLAASITDPLYKVLLPTKPPVPDPTKPNTSKLCGDSTPVATMYPGYYAANTTLKGCLASGIYWVDGTNTNSKLTLDGVTAASRGVSIFVKNGSVEFKNAINLSPMSLDDTSLNTEEQNVAGVTLFLDRDDTGSVKVGGQTVTVAGYTYAAKGTLDLQASGANYRTGAVDVYKLSVQGNGTITLL